MKFGVDHDNIVFVFDVSHTYLHIAMAPSPRSGRSTAQSREGIVVAPLMLLLLLLVVVSRPP